MKREGSSSEGAVSLWALSFCQLPECNSRRFWSLSLQSLPSIPRRAQHTHFLANKQTHTHKTLKFFFFVVRTSVFFPKVRNESIPNCATLEGKSVCAWFKCCWSISARRRRSKRACRELQEFFFSVSGTPLLKIRVRRTTAVFLIYSHLSVTDFHTRFPHSRPCETFVGLSVLFGLALLFPGVVVYVQHTYTEAHTHTQTYMPTICTGLSLSRKKGRGGRASENK